VYLLAGMNGAEDTFTDRVAKLLESGNRLSAAQGFSDAIVVTPNAAMADGSTLYTSAPAAGDWERFIAETLVSEIDRRYRTLPARLSRGLAGHDAGGYAAFRLGMKRPDLFSGLYVMSACCLVADGARTDPAMKEGVTPAMALLVTSAANLQRYYAIGIDVGRQDPLLGAHRQMHQALTRLRVPHAFEEYDGDHTNMLGERLASRLLPFFSKNLVAPANPTSPQIKD
jgi:enterochelin esterase-like enzyme